MGRLEELLSLLSVLFFLFSLSFFLGCFAVGLERATQITKETQMVVPMKDSGCAGASYRATTALSGFLLFFVPWGHTTRFPEVAKRCSTPLSRCTPESKHSACQIGIIPMCCLFPRQPTTQKVCKAGRHHINLL